MGSHHPAEHDMKTAVAKGANRILHDEGPVIDDALRQGVRDALLLHEERGKRVVVERGRHSRERSRKSAERRPFSRPRVRVRAALDYCPNV